MKNLTTNLQELKNKVELLKIEVSKDKTTLKESKEASKRLLEIIKLTSSGEEIENINELREEMENLMPLLSKSQNVERIESFEKTLSMDLMLVETRYVMVEEGKKINSPAGFHPDSKIYTKPKGVVILTNRLPKQSNLSYYDLKK